MSEKIPQQEKISGKEQILKEIEAVIDTMKSDYDWGGGEDDEGVLHPGNPDFEGAKKKIRKIILGGSE